MAIPQTAVLGGGCFWCLEAVFEQLHGVLAVRSGYCGGPLPQPDYASVCGGHTGHAEVVELSFDPARLSFRTVLEVFFTIHDPTTLNRQGNDVGTQYRSVIFWQDEAQRATAASLLAELEAGDVFDAPIVTELAPPAPFWPAEPAHQGYYRGHAAQPYCAIVIAPKLAKFRDRFARLVRGGASG